MFTEKEIEYLKTQRLARLGTASNKGVVDVAPVGFDFDGKYFYIGSRNMKKTRKYWNIKSNINASLVIDDLETIDPWKPRGLKVLGRADFVERNGYVGSGLYIRFIPEVHWSWGIDDPVLNKEGTPTYKKIKHEITA